MQILGQISELTDASGKSATPFFKKCVQVAPVDATVKASIDSISRIYWFCYLNALWHIFIQIETFVKYGRIDHLWVIILTHQKVSRSLGKENSYTITHVYQNFIAVYVTLEVTDTKRGVPVL